jgi:hypothetical protein
LPAYIYIHLFLVYSIIIEFLPRFQKFNGRRKHGIVPKMYQIASIKYSYSQAPWCMPALPATREVEAGKEQSSRPAQAKVAVIQQN